MEVLSYNDTVIQGTIMCWLCHMLATGVSENNCMYFFCPGNKHTLHQPPLTQTNLKYTYWVRGMPCKVLIRISIIRIVRMIRIFVFIWNSNKYKQSKCTDVLLYTIQCDPFLPIPLYCQSNQSPGQVTVSWD
jgi:hypothetical protein